MTFPDEGQRHLDTGPPLTVLTGALAGTFIVVAFGVGAGDILVTLEVGLGAGDLACEEVVEEARGAAVLDTAVSFSCRTCPT